jgi:beta-glucosidase
LWFSHLGGWESDEAVFLFGKFVDYLAKTLGHQVSFWLTLNEPWILVEHAYLRGLWPPQKKSLWSLLKVFNKLTNAHKTAYNIIKSYHPEAQVGVAENNVYFEGWASSLAHWWVNRRFLDMVGRRMDFIGLNYYFHNKIKGLEYNQNENKEISDLGWEIYPEGIYHVLKNLKKYKKPIYITENGIADAGDEKRSKFIKEHLYWVHRAISSGADVKGYFYWSLLDNFEWDKGFWPRFGLIGIDYKTFERKVRPSAYEYAKICKENILIL